MTYNSYRPSHLLSLTISTALFHRVLDKLPLRNGSGSFLDQRGRAAIAAFYCDAKRQLEREAGIALADS